MTGLPPLPPGEAVLWSGAPCWRSLARRLCKVRGVAMYVGLVAAGTAAVCLAEGDGPAVVALTVLPILAAGALVLGFLLLLAWLVARTTRYTLTTERLVMQHGIALPAMLAIPYRGIARMAVAIHGDHTGDLPIETKPGFEVALRQVWPHARPWRLARAQPMLRSVRQAGIVAALLARSLAEAERREHAPARLLAAE